MATVMTPVVASAVPEGTTGIAPIIIDLGKEKKKRIKDLKRGRGRLMAEVASVLSEVRAGIGNDADGKQLVPVVLIYKKKNRKWKGRDGGRFFPFLF
jgi:Family of unknown function (DUF6200)